MILCVYILTAKDKTVIKNAQAAKNHWTLHTANGSSIPANKTIVEAGIKMLVTNKSASATFTINALPGIECVLNSLIGLIVYNNCTTLYARYKDVFPSSHITYFG